jgi:RNA polymerase sigma-70 factor, ECF subfamily
MDSIDAHPVAEARACESLHTRFVELIERHRGVVFKVAGSYAWQADDRDELAQEITAQLWRAFPGYDEAYAFSTWMYRIALNVAMSHVRSRVRHNAHHVPFDALVHDVADPGTDDPESSARLLALQRVIAEQPPLDRALLLLVLDGCAHREIAEVLGLTETHVATKVHRLRQRLRARVD